MYISYCVYDSMCVVISARTPLWPRQLPVSHLARLWCSPRGGEEWVNPVYRGCGLNSPHCHLWQFEIFALVLMSYKLCGVI